MTKQIGYYTGAKKTEELQGAEIVFYTSNFTTMKQLSAEKRDKAFAVSGGLPKETELSWLQRLDRVNKKGIALIPDYGRIVKQYLNGRITEAEYVEAYMKRLEKITPLDVIEDGMILCCYENIDKFCHRHLIAKWAEDWGRAHGIKIVCAGEYGDRKTIGGLHDNGTKKPEPKSENRDSKSEPKQQDKVEVAIVSVDKQFSAIICKFTEEQIVQYAEKIRDVAKIVKSKVNGGNSEFTDLILSFTVEQIRGCADLIVQAAKQFA